MPRPKSLIPAYLLHKATGQARVRIDGKDHYLGAYGSEDSRRKYGAIIAASSSGGLIDPFSRQRPTTIPEDPGPAVAVLWLAFLKHAETYYVKNGQQTDEVRCYRSAMAHVIELYGLLPIAEFGPSQLKTARNRMIDAGWSRKYINKSICRIRHVFKWGIESDMVEPVTLERLKAVSPLKSGKTEAVDHPAREAVPMANIEAVKQRVKQQAKDLIDLLLLSGARPGEIIGLKTGDIDRSGLVWVAVLADHKNAHHGKTRKVFFGPKAQLILRRYLKANPAVRLFATSRNSFYQCIVGACARADVPRWSPHWLRHNAATEVRDTFGLEHAQAMAGHSTPNMTARYSTKMDRLATEAAAKLG